MDYHESGLDFGTDDARSQRRRWRTSTEHVRDISGY